jgi:hypothetical protein
VSILRSMIPLMASICCQVAESSGWEILHENSIRHHPLNTFVVVISREGGGLQWDRRWFDDRKPQTSNR